MPKKKKASPPSFGDRLEAFNNDLISLFNKHHICMLFQVDDLRFIGDGYFVENLGRVNLDGRENVIIPICSDVDWDALIKLEGDLP